MYFPKIFAHDCRYLQLLAIIYPGMSRYTFPGMLLFSDNNIQGNNISRNYFTAIFKTRNGESGNGMGNGTRKAGIFKTRNEKYHNPQNYYFIIS